MANQRYTYTGPNSAITITEDGKATDVMLWQNTEVNLPAEDEHVNVMSAMGYLTAIATPDMVEAQEPASAVEADADSKPKRK